MGFERRNLIITKTQKDCLREEQIRKAALAGCNKCPCCGEDRTFSSYCRDGIINKGIISRTCKNWYGKKYELDKSIFYNLFSLEKDKYYQIDCFECLTCGAEWESDPYTYDK